MKTKIAELIEASQVLTPEKKQTYLRILKFLPEEQLKALLEILQKERISAEEIRKNAQKEKSAVNNQYIQKFEDLYKEEFKSAVSDEEKDDKSQAENVLNQIDNHE